MVIKKSKSLVQHSELVISFELNDKRGVKYVGRICMNFVFCKACGSWIGNCSTDGEVHQPRGENGCRNPGSRLWASPLLGPRASYLLCLWHWPLHGIRVEQKRFLLGVRNPERQSVFMEGSSSLGLRPQPTPNPGSLAGGTALLGFCSVGISLRRIGSCFCPCWGEQTRGEIRSFFFLFDGRQPHCLGVKPCASKCLKCTF